MIPYVAESNPRAAETLSRLRVPVDHSIAGAALHAGRPVRVDDPRANPHFFAAVDRETEVPTRNLLAAPLRGP